MNEFVVSFIASFIITGITSYFIFKSGYVKGYKKGERDEEERNNKISTYKSPHSLYGRTIDHDEIYLARIAGFWVSNVWRKGKVDLNESENEAVLMNKETAEHLRKRGFEILTRKYDSVLKIEGE